MPSSPNNSAMSGCGGCGSADSGCAGNRPVHTGRSPGGWSRRQFLQESSFGFGAAALSYLLAADGLRADDRVRLAAPGTSTTLRPSSPHFHAQANAVIVLLQNGGPSQMDLFDPKPELQK